MAKQQKYYVVWRGRRTGVFDNWAEAKEQIEGFHGPQYKSFLTEEEARKAFDEGFKATQKAKYAAPTDAPVMLSIAVDAACSGNPGVMEYRGVQLWDKQEIFHLKFDLGTNNIGEFLALVHGLALLKQRGCPEVTIYSDSQIAIGWVKAGRCRTKLEYTPRTAELFDLVKRAEQWLAANPNTPTPIVKWPTEKWGEIPADFGRKGNG